MIDEHDQLSNGDIMGEYCQEENSDYDPQIEEEQSIVPTIFSFC